MLAYGMSRRVPRREHVFSDIDADLTCHRQAFPALPTPKRGVFGTDRGALVPNRAVSRQNSGIFAFGASGKVVAARMEASPARMVSPARRAERGWRGVGHYREDVCGLQEEVLK